MGYGNDLVTMLKGNFTTMQPSYDDGPARADRDRPERAAPAAPQAVHDDVDRQEGQRDRRGPRAAHRQRTASASRSRSSSTRTPRASRSPFRSSPSTTSTTSTSCSSGRASAATSCSSRRPTASSSGNGSCTSGRRKPGMIPGLRDVMFELALGRVADRVQAQDHDREPGRLGDGARVAPHAQGAHQPDRDARRRADQRQRGPAPHPQRVRRARGDRGRRAGVHELPGARARDRDPARPDQADGHRRGQGRRAARPARRPDRRGSAISARGSSGKYFVTKTTHTIDDNGYITSFSCRREQYKGGAEAVTRIYGVVIGLVKDVDDPDGWGRIRVAFPWLGPDGRRSERLGADRAHDGRQGSRLLVHARGRRRGARRVRARRRRPPDRRRLPAQRRRHAARLGHRRESPAAEDGQRPHSRVRRPRRTRDASC